MEGKVRANVRLAHSMTSTLESQPTQSSRYVPWRPTSSPAGEPREFGLYNGVSNRARGWKSKTVGQFVENQAPAHESMRRWDGATKTWQPWDYLRRVCTFSLLPIASWLRAFGRRHPIDSMASTDVPCLHCFSPAFPDKYHGMTSRKAVAAHT